jgi:hypothetical protein
MQKTLLFIFGLVSLFIQGQEINGNMPEFSKGKINQIDYFSYWNGKIKLVKTKFKRKNKTNYRLQAYSESGVVINQEESDRRMFNYTAPDVRVTISGDTTFIYFDNNSTEEPRYQVCKKKGDLLEVEYYAFNDLYEKYTVQDDTVILYEKWASGKINSGGVGVAYKYEYNKYGLEKVYQSSVPNVFLDQNLIYDFQYKDSSMIRTDYFFRDKEMVFAKKNEYVYSKKRNRYYDKSSPAPFPKTYKTVSYKNIDSVIVYNKESIKSGWYCFKYNKDGMLIEYEDTRQVGLTTVNKYKYDKKGNVRKEKYYLNKELEYTRKTKYTYWD